jgi:hypothetical protein
MLCDDETGVAHPADVVRRGGGRHVDTAGELADAERTTVKLEQHP